MRNVVKPVIGAIALMGALCSGVAHASTLSVAFEISNNNSDVTSAELNLVSSTVADFTNFTGTLVSCTSCGPPTTASGQLNNGATDSTIVTTGNDGATFDLVFGDFNAANATTVVLNDGVVTSISWSDYLFATNDSHSCGNCILSLNSTEIGAYSGVPGPLEADMTLPPATPLPAALPLFATGLGSLGLLGWRRRRKSAAPIAV